MRTIHVQLLASLSCHLGSGTVDTGDLDILSPSASRLVCLTKGICGLTYFIHLSEVQFSVDASADLTSKLRIIPSLLLI